MNELLTLLNEVQVHDLSFYISKYGIAGIFLFFITLDQFTPIPEEISLLTIGYFSSRGLFDPYLGGLAALAGFLTVDTGYFFIVKSGKKWSERLRKKMSQSFMEKITDKFRQNFPRALFILYFIPRMRMIAPWVAGILQIRYVRFVVYDALCLSVFTILYMSLGYFFHRGMEQFIAEFRTLQNVIFWCSMGGVAIVIYLVIRKYRHADSR